jgi:hypothetical protein
MSPRKSRPQRPTSGWSPTMERRAADRDGKQVKCLIASEGHLWMRGYYDRLPKPVRARLAESPHNICAACLTEETERVAARLGKKLSVAIYLAVIAAIERKLQED